MAVFHSPETPYAKELWKWNHTTADVNPHDPSIRGLRPVGFQEFPKMVYQAGHSQSGPIIITEQEIARDSYEESRLLGRGFSLTQEQAIAKVHGLDQDVAVAAAQRHYTDRRMSANAQAEAAAADAETDAHVGAVPETPTRGAAARAALKRKRDAAKSQE